MFSPVINPVNQDFFQAGIKERPMANFPLPLPFGKYFSKGRAAA